MQYYSKIILIYESLRYSCCLQILVISMSLEFCKVSHPASASAASTLYTAPVRSFRLVAVIFCSCGLDACIGSSNWESLSELVRPREPIPGVALVDASPSPSKQPRQYSAPDSSAPDSRRQFSKSRAASNCRHSFRRRHTTAHNPYRTAIHSSIHRTRGGTQQSLHTLPIMFCIYCTVHACY